MEKTTTKPKSSGLVDQTRGNLAEQIAFARKMKDDSLIYALQRLRDINRCTKGAVTTIYTDFAPRSFYFVRKYPDGSMNNGGIIYHGSHDAGGNGSAPTFSVSMSPTNGWSTHT